MYFLNLKISFKIHNTKYILEYTFLNIYIMKYKIKKIFKIETPRSIFI